MEKLKYNPIKNLELRIERLVKRNSKIEKRLAKLLAEKK